MKQTTLCYIHAAGKTLLMHRTKKKNDLNGGKWIGVGGKFEPGETAEECLLREVKEETGLTLTGYRCRGVVDFLSDKWEDEAMHLFTADAFTGELLPPEKWTEGDLQWVPDEQVAALPTWEGDRIFWELIRRDEPFFRLTLCYDAEDKLKSAALNGTPLTI